MLTGDRRRLVTRHPQPLLVASGVGCRGYSPVMVLATMYTASAEPSQPASCNPTQTLVYCGGQVNVSLPCPVLVVAKTANSKRVVTEGVVAEGGGGSRKRVFDHPKNVAFDVNRTDHWRYRRH